MDYPGETYAHRFMRAHGYISEIKLDISAPPFLCPVSFHRVNSSSRGWRVSPHNEWDGTATPAHLQICVLIPWRYGTTVQESSASHLFVRVKAFISRAFFRTPVQVLAVGEPAVVSIEPTDGK